MFSIDANTAIQTTRDPLDNVSVQRADSRGNIIEVARLDAQGTLLTKVGYEYNVIGEMLRALDAEGNPVTVSYDMLGRKVSLESIDSGRETYQYNDYGQLWRVSNSLLQSKGHYIRYDYDDFGRIIRIDYPQSSDILYVYGSPSDTLKNQAGRVIRVSDADSCVEYEYGCLGETIVERKSIASEIDGLGRMKDFYYELSK